MSFLRNGYERVKGALKVLVGGAAAFGLADIIKNVLKEQGVVAGADFLKSLTTGKGLLNEATYGYIFSKCNLKTKERDLFIKAFEGLRQNGNEKEKEAANNFIILVAINKEKKGSFPGEKIILDITKRMKDYATEAEKIKMITESIIHFGTDAEVKTQTAAIKKWALETWENQIKPNLKQIDNFSKKYKRSSKKALRDFEKRPLWKKLLLN